MRRLLDWAHLNTRYRMEQPVSMKWTVSHGSPRVSRSCFRSLAVQLTRHNSSHPDQFILCPATALSKSHSQVVSRIRSIFTDTTSMLFALLVAPITTTRTPFDVTLWASVGQVIMLLSVSPRTTLVHGSCIVTLTGISRRELAHINYEAYILTVVGVSGLAVVFAEDIPDVASANPPNSESFRKTCRHEFWYAVPQVPGLTCARNIMRTTLTLNSLSWIQKIEPQWKETRTLIYYFCY